MDSSLKAHSDFIKRLEHIFNVKVDVNIKLINTREEMDSILGFETPEWIAATTKGGVISIFPKEIFEKVTNHKLKDYNQIINHEIAHFFIYKAFGKCAAWFNEGLACFLAGQTKSTKDLPDPSKLVSYEAFKADKTAYAKSVKLVLHLLESLQRNL